jgi:hypothetical protein
VLGDPWLPVCDDVEELEDDEEDALEVLSDEEEEEALEL